MTTPDTAQPAAPAGLRPDPTTAMLRAMSRLDRIIEERLPRALAAALLAASAEAATDAEMCGRCAARQARFNRVHREAVRFAYLQACGAHDVDPENPGREIDLTEFLPEELRPDPADPISETRFPTPFRKVTTIAGWGLCSFDVASDEADLAAQQAAQAQAAPPVPAGPPATRPTLLLPPAGMSAHAAARAVRHAAPGSLPGIPGQ